MDLMDLSIAYNSLTVFYDPGIVFQHAGISPLFANRLAARMASGPGRCRHTRRHAAILFPCVMIRHFHQTWLQWRLFIM